MRHQHRHQTPRSDTSNELKIKIKKVITCVGHRHMLDTRHIQSEVSVLRNLYQSNFEEQDNHVMEQQLENDLGHHTEQAS